MTPSLEWDASTPGVLVFPSGRVIRGRSLRHPVSADQDPTFGIYLQRRRPPLTPWPMQWIRWPDFWLPSDDATARATLTMAWESALDGRVEIACGGGRGRTGTALACIAVLDGVAPDEAVQFVRAHYDRRAVETAWQRRYVRRYLDGYI